MSWLAGKVILDMNANISVAVMDEELKNVMRLRGCVFVSLDTSEQPALTPVHQDSTGRIVKEHANVNMEFVATNRVSAVAIQVGTVIHVSFLVKQDGGGRTVTEDVKMMKNVTDLLATN